MNIHIRFVANFLLASFMCANMNAINSRGSINIGVSYYSGNDYIDPLPINTSPKIRSTVEINENSAVINKKLVIYTKKWTWTKIMGTVIFLIMLDELLFLSNKSKVLPKRREVPKFDTETWTYVTDTGRDTGTGTGTPPAKDTRREVSRRQFKIPPRGRGGRCIGGFTSDRKLIRLHPRNTIESFLYGNPRIIYVL
jgi:hypothetical protein